MIINRTFVDILLYHPALTPTIAHTCLPSRADADHCAHRAKGGKHALGPRIHINLHAPARHDWETKTNAVVILFLRKMLAEMMFTMTIIA